MAYDIFKALHLIFMVTWFAGLFYIVRLFIYHTEAHENDQISADQKSALISQFQIMQRRLWYGITWPSAILNLVFGLALLSYFMPLTDHIWLKIKLFLLFLLWLYHLSCGHIFKKLKNNLITYTPTQLRVWNEVATIFLVGIIFLAVFRQAMALMQGLLGLAALTIVLMLTIKIYKNIREK